MLPENLNTVDLSGVQFSESALQLARRGGQYQFYREITELFHVEPGIYVIVPSTYDPRMQADYLLRVYTESLADGR